MIIRCLWAFLLIGVLLLSGCGTPTLPVSPQGQTPEAITSRTPLAVLPTPIRPTPTIDPSLLNPLDSWPVILNETRIDINYDPWLYPRPMLIDPDNDYLYISGTPGQTRVLSTDDLTEITTLDSGGNLALDTAKGRLFIGIPGKLDVYNIKSGNRLTQLTLAQSPSGVTEFLLPSIPLLNKTSGDIYVIQTGLHLVSGAGLAATTLLGESRDVRDIALDEQHQTLYVSINNGVPGSNNRDDLWALDLRSRQLKKLVPGVWDFAIDKAHEQLLVTLSARFDTPGSLQAWSGQPLTQTYSLSNVSGPLVVDEERDRLYVLTSGPANRLMALQASTLAIVADVTLPGLYAAMVLDAQADRLYLLSEDGYLLIVSGHGGSTPRAQSVKPVQPPGLLVTRLIVSPDWARDKTIYGLWRGALPQGETLLVSTDGGVTWDTVGGDLLASSGVTDLAFSPNLAQDQTMFAATLRGVFRSTDKGRSWQPASAGLDDLWVVQLAVSPGYARDSTIYARTFSGGLHRSDDGGQTWLSLADNYAALSQDQKTRAMALSPDFENDRTLFLSVPQGGGQLLLSYDAGDSWLPVADAGVSALYPSPGFAQDLTLFGMFDHQGLLRSTDGGLMWRGALRNIRGASGGDSLALSPDFSRDRTALLLTRNPVQLYRTTDNGESWQISRSALVTNTTAVALSGQSENQGQTAWLGTASGQVLTTKLDDLLWAVITATLPTQQETIVLSPAFEQDGTVFVAGKESGVWISNDKGQSWRDSGFPAREVGIGRMHLAISPNYASDQSVFAATGSQLYRSTDAGNSWQALPIGPGGLFPINDLAVSPNYVSDRTLMLAGDFRLPIVLRSSDGGESWQPSVSRRYTVESGLPITGGLNLLAFSPNFAADRGAYVWAESEGLYRSGDGGQNWARVYQPTGSWLVQSFVLSPNFGLDRLMFLGTLKENHNVYRSADGGASWHPTELGLPLELLWASALALSPDFERDRLIFLGTDRGVYRSSDGGQTWRQAANLPEVVELAISPGAVGDYTIFAVSTRQGLYMSTDSGERWSPVN